MINESNQEQNTPQHDPITKIRNKIKAKYDAEYRTHNTDLAMSKLQEVVPTRASKANGTTQIQIARREIEEKLTQMLELHKQIKKGKHAILYLRVSTFPQAKFDIDTPMIVEGSIVRRELTEQAIKDQAVKERNLSKREKYDTEVTEETQDSMKGSLRQQAKFCYKHAKEQGYYVTKIIVDIHTGYELYGREGLEEARYIFKQGDAEVMVSLCLDRVSRNMLDTLILVTEFNEYGIRLDCVLEVIDTSRLGMLILAVQAYGNEDERDRILRRTTTGKQDKIERGELVGHGDPGYGYIWIKNEHGRNIARDFDPNTYKIVRGIGEAYMNGVTMGAICRDLEARGIKTAKGLSRWQLTQISDILQDPKYRGIATAGRYKRVKKGGSDHVVKNPDVYIYPESVSEKICPAYWTPEECELIDAQLERNKRDNIRNNQHTHVYEFLLRYPFIRCGHCGSTMACDFTDKDRPIYRCRNKRKRNILTGDLCSGCAIYADVLDPAIWKQVTPLLRNTGIMAELLTKLEEIDLSEQAVTDYDNTINKARKLLDKLTLRRDSLDEEDEEDQEVIASIERGIEEQKRIIKMAKEKKAEILPTAQEQDRRRTSIKKFLSWADKTSAALQETCTLVEKRDALAALGIKVYVFRMDSGCDRWRMETTLENFKLPGSTSLQLKNSAYVAKNSYPANAPYLIAITPTRAFLNPELFAS